MANLSSKTKAEKPFFQGVQSEFKKIIWPDRDQVFRQSVAVLVVSLVMGAFIAVLDFGIQYGINFLTSL